MLHITLIEETLKNFSSEQLSVIFIDSTLDKSDVEKLSLELHITECSENWLLPSYNMSCDCRSPNSIDDMMDYINTNLKPITLLNNQAE